MTRRPHHRQRLASIALAVSALSISLAACSGDDAAPTSEAGSTSSSGAEQVPAEPDPIGTTASIERVEGDLDRLGRDRLRERVRLAVDAWIDGAYGGDYPREDFSDAFTTFTDGARARAVIDEALTSNASVGTRVDDVRAVRRRLRIDVLGVDGVAVGVTARVDLAFELSGQISRRDRVTGSLFLTYETSGGAPGWRVFGYDLKREDV